VLPWILHKGTVTCLTVSLIVPNVKNVQSKSIFEIAVELNRLKELAAKGQLGTADLSGGTITLSNIGNIGGTLLHPVLVSSEVCIGAVGRIQRLPRYELDKVVPHEVMAVSWNADHRVVDGATVARFVRIWKQYLETPSTFLADLK
jgi:2-oxoisovalerate dehydrogenase E2 component (dihydrolipoyl transacylase)